MKTCPRCRRLYTAGGVVNPNTTCQWPGTGICLVIEAAFATGKAEAQATARIVYKDNVPYIEWT